MERGNQPTGGGGSESGTLVDPGVAGAGGGPSSVANPGSAGDEPEVSWDMIDFDQMEELEDGTMRFPFVDDNGEIVSWGEATTGTFADGLDEPLRAGESRVLEIGGHWFEAQSDGSLTRLEK